MLVVLMLGAALLSLIIELGVEHLREIHALQSAPGKRLTKPERQMNGAFSMASRAEG
jgi:hypothetical protein